MKIISSTDLETLYSTTKLITPQYATYTDVTHTQNRRLRNNTAKDFISNIPIIKPNLTLAKDFLSNIPLNLT